MRKCFSTPSIALASLVPVFCAALIYSGTKPTAAAETSEPVVICVFPVAVADERDRDDADKISAGIIRTLKNIRRIEVRTIREIAEVVPGARDSSDYNPKVRHILMKELSAELIFTGNIRRDDDGRMMYEYTLTRTDSDVFVRRGTISTQSIDHYIEKHEDELKASVAAYRKGRRPSRKELAPYSGRKITVCVIALWPRKTGDARLSEEISDEITGRLSEHPEYTVIGMNEIRKAAPGLRSFGDFSEPLRSRLAGALSPDFIIGGEIGSNQHNQVSGGIIVVSGRTGKELYKMGLQIFGSNRAGERADPQGSFAKTAENAITGLVKKIGEKSAEPQETPLIREWEKAARGVKIRPGFQYPKPDQAGTLIAVEKGSPLPYYLHRPPDYDTTKWSYPLVIFLHGTSARSDTLTPRVIFQSPMSAISRFKDGQPSYDETALLRVNQYLKGSFVLMPQLRLTGDPAWDPEEVNRLVALIIDTYPVDTRRVYLIGCSRGGAGTWSYANLLHSKIAAAVPICGYADGMSGKAEREWLGGMPIWAFHAYDDDNISIEMGSVVFESILPGELLPGDRNIWQGYPHLNGDRSKPAAFDCTISAVKGVPGPWERGVIYPKGSLTFTVFRAGGHNIMGRVYGNRDLWKWMYAQSR